MSPEQANGDKNVGRPTDIYSFAVMLHQLLTGSMPYAISGNHIIGDVQRPKILPMPDHWPTPLKKLMILMLRLNPASRPTMEEVTKELQKIVDTPAKKRSRFKMLIAAAIIGTLFVLSDLWIYDATKVELLIPAKETPKVILLPFINQTNKASLNWLETGLMDSLHRQLNKVSGIEVSPVGEMISTINGMGIQTHDTFKDEHYKKLKSAFGGNFGVQVKVSKSSDGFIVQPKYRYKETTTVGKSFPITDISHAIPLLTKNILLRIHPQGLSTNNQDMPTTDLAAKSYMIGRQHQLTGQQEKAKFYFEVVMDQDPAFIPVRLNYVSSLNSLSLWQESLNYAQKLDYSLFSIDERFSFDLTLADAKTCVGQTDQALESLKKSMVYAEQTQKYRSKLSAYYHIALQYKRMGYHILAKKNYQLAYQISKTLNAKVNQAHIASDLSQLNRFNKNISLPLNYAKECEEIGRELGNKSLLALASFDYGLLESEHRNSKEAIRHYLKARDLFEASSQIYEISLIYSYLSASYLMENKSDLALNFANKAIDTAKVQHFPRGILQGQLQLAYVLNSLKNLKILFTISNLH